MVERFSTTDILFGVAKWKGFATGSAGQKNESKAAWVIVESSRNPTLGLSANPSGKPAVRKPNLGLDRRPDCELSGKPAIPSENANYLIFLTYWLRVGFREDSTMTPTAT
jgi:hypothetical protein